MLGPVDRGDGQGALGAGDGGSHDRLGGEDRRHAAAGRQRLHQAAALGDQAQPVFEAEQPGDAGRHVLAEAVAQHDGRFDAP